MPRCVKLADWRSSTDANGEMLVCDYLTVKGLSVQRFDKVSMRRSRTPDFRVLAGHQLAFYCEVKTAQEDDWLERQLGSAPPGTLVGGLRRDSTYNRISSYVHGAAGQFDAVNPECDYPNVLAIVNNDSDAGLPDLLAVLTGNAYTNSGPVRMFGTCSDGRIREEKRRIHLYLWFDPAKPEPFKVWSQSPAGHHAVLCGHFGVDPASIMQI